ncbi:MAG TPA: O-acetyl-ADP-ribose deacetylase [Rectinemataceae bacterium]|nr:O-acetyl-ADP-ribose deacetylase [Rectinemataceae bacterium]
MKATIEVILGDITKVEVDAIVNAANEGLWGGGGVDGAIHAAAGPSLAADCDVIRERDDGCPTGKAVATGAGRLPCRRVIHTVGPIWSGGGEGEAELLASCYRESLELARREGLRSLAFPNISTGVYGFPKAKAAEIARRTVREWFSENEGIDRVVFVCFDRENFTLYEGS